MDIKQLYEFIKQMEKFKEIERFRGQFYWRDYPQKERYESTADHTWRMAIILVLIQNKLSQTIDLAKALKMTLIHDLPEIISGDPSPLGEKGTGLDSHAYSSQHIQRKYDEESLACQKLFSQLPDSVGKELIKLWEEFEAGETFEAQLVRAIDKWEAKLQVLHYTSCKMFPEHLDFTLKYRDEYFNFDPFLRELMDTLKDDFLKNYQAFK